MKKFQKEAIEAMQRGESIGKMLEDAIFKVKKLQDDAKHLLKTGGGKLRLSSEEYMLDWQNAFAELDPNYVLD